MGNFLLEKASCKDHERVTSFFEGKALRGMFGSVREHENIGSGRRKKRPPLFVTYENPDGSTERVEVDQFQHPYMLTMPLLQAPGILMGRNRDLGFPATIQSRSHTHDAARRRMRKLMAADPRGRSLIWPLDVGNFTKFVAKVGYCYAVFFMGEVFQPLVLDLILSRQEDCTLGPYFVGGAFEQPGQQYPPLPTKHKFSTVVRVEKIDSRAFVIARSQFFNDRGMPIYDAVVGELDSDDAKRYFVDSAG